MGESSASGETGSPQEVGFVTIPDLTSYSPERLNYTIGSILDDRFEVSLVGPERTSNRLANRFPCRSYYPRQLPGTLQPLLLFPLTLLTVLSYVREAEPAVVASVGNLYVNGLACALIGRLTGTTSVVRVTSDLFTIYRYQETRRGRFGAFFRNNIMGRVAVHTADHVIVLGPVMRGKLETKGVDRECLHAIPQPLLFEEDIDTTDSDTQCHRKAELVRTRYSIDSEATVALFVGYFARVKGPERLIRTLEYVLDRDAETEFLILGSGGEHEETVREALDDYDGVHFAGWVEHSELTAYYRTADVLIQPSNSEGLPNVVLEALVHEIPVVATDSGGEVPVYVSNIGRDYRELGDLLLDPEQLIRDPVPPILLPERNRERYIELFEACARESTPSLDGKSCTY